MTTTLPKCLNENVWRGEPWNRPFWGQGKYIRSGLNRRWAYNLALGRPNLTPWADAAQRGWVVGLTWLTPPSLPHLLSHLYSSFTACCCCWCWFFAINNNKKMLDRLSHLTNSITPFFYFPFNFYFFFGGEGVCLSRYLTFSPIICYSLCIFVFFIYISVHTSLSSSYVLFESVTSCFSSSTSYSIIYSLIPPSIYTIIVILLSLLHSPWLSPSITFIQFYSPRCTLLSPRSVIPPAH